MEQELRLLRAKVEELTEENKALREINIKFQLDSYKLQKKIESLEKSQVVFETTAIEKDSKWSDQIQQTKKESQHFKVEYLEEEFDPATESNDTDIKYLIDYDPETEEDSTMDEMKDEIPDTEDSTSVDYQGQNVDDTISDVIAGVDRDLYFRNKFINPKQAMKIVRNVAARKGVVQKLRSIETSGADSFFVGKVLEVLFTSEVLANSSALGNKCQRKSQLEARPALEPSKLQICRQAYVHRLKSCNLTPDAFNQRMKMFNNYVNHKLQNMRKLSEREGKRKTLITYP